MSIRLPFAARLAPFALVLACQQPAAAPAAPAGLTDADHAALDSLHNVFSAAAVAGNFDAISAMYTEDAKLLGPNMPVATGRIAIKGALSAFPPIGEMKIIGHETHGSGDLAAVRGTYTMLMVPPGSPAIADTGKFVELWRKQADGTWLLVWDMFSSDKPAPAVH